MPYYPHGDKVRRLGSPGYELEDSFDTFLYECEDEGRYNLSHHEWLSEKKKIVFDFRVYTPYKWFYKLFYVDVVGYYYQDRRIKLVTGHKDWNEMLEFAKMDSNSRHPRCYLAFDWYGFWNFLKITDDLPNYDIYLSTKRIHGIRQADSVFNKIEPKRYPLRREKYLLNKRQEKAIDNWIGSPSNDMAFE